MILKSIEKLFTITICALLLAISSPQVSSFADLSDISHIGGSYERLRGEVSQYRREHPGDPKRYECHHLISKGALNGWAGKISFNKYNNFLSDFDQDWAPSIVMEKADHEKTLSYYNKDGTPEQKMKAIAYIEWQEQSRVDKGDIMGVLEEEFGFIKVLFGNKYDRAIEEVKAYIRRLNFRHLGGRVLYMRHPYNPTWHYKYIFAK